MAKKNESWLIVDGYNVIGLDQQQLWQPSQLEEKRALLIRDLSEYQSITGKKVFIVFDAHNQPGAQSKIESEKVTIIYTSHGVTADEWIERFVRENRVLLRKIYVATSDYMEQRMVFGQGAYRISSRELLDEIQDAKRKIKQLTKNGQKTTIFDQLSTEMQQKLEKWRRKK